MLYDNLTYTEIIKQGHPIEIHGVITFADGSTRTISCEDIPVGGLTIERRVVTGDSFEIGTAICGELELKLYISESEEYIKYYDAILELYCRISANPEVNGLYSFGVALGTWTFIDVKKSKNILNIIAYDTVLKLDTKLKRDLSGNWRNILAQIREDCGTVVSVTCKTPIPNIDGARLDFPMFGGHCTTYRQVLSAIAQMCGCFVRELGLNYVDLHDFENSPCTSLSFTPENIYTSDIAAADYSINSIVVEFDDSMYSISSDENITSGHEYRMSSPVVWEILRKQHGYAVVEDLNNSLGEALFSLNKFRPCELTVISDPRIECGDRYTLSNDDGVYEIVVTGYVWRLNDRMEITCAGKDERLVRTSTSSSNYNSYYINEAEETSIEESAIILHKFTNNSKVVSDEDYPLIADVTFLANRDTFVTFNGTLQVSSTARI